MNIKTLKVGPLETNCYILTKDNNQLIIDPGDNSKEIIKNIDKNLIGILLTHRHPDHIGALNTIKEYFNVKVYDKSNLKEGINKINNFQFEVIYNPGHTFDSISFLFNKDLFSGDFIFKDSIGRTDLGGNRIDMINSITKILNYSTDLIIYPGHGPKTILKNEIEMLDYFKENL